MLEFDSSFCDILVVRYELSLKAIRQIERLSKDIKIRVIEAIERMCEEWPQARNVRDLVNREGLRLRVGNFRVIFMVTEDAIQVMEVKKRDERTY